MKPVFQSSLVLILLNWGLVEEYIAPSRLQKRRNFRSGCSTKKHLGSCQIPCSKLSWDNLVKFVFQSSLGHLLLDWRLAEDCIPPSWFGEERNFWFGCSTKQVLRWLSDSELKKLSWDNLTKIVFQSSLALVLLDWGLAEECIPPSRFQKRRKFDLVDPRKKVLGWLPEFELKKFSLINFTKRVFQSSRELILLNWGLL